MDAKSQTTFRSFDIKLGTHVLKIIYKKILTSVQIEQALTKIRNDR